MSRHRQNYSLIKVGDIWYYRTYDVYGKRTTKKSTGERSKPKAHIYCQNLLKDQLLIFDPSLKFKAIMAI